jgi:hypothetical protein
MNLTEISKGIPHIEDLPVAEFVRTINSLHEYEITEKLDGAEILFGIDEIGFYTSREAKGGVRIYEEQHYDIRFPTTYMRAAHKLLEETLPLLKAAGLKEGDQVEAEVLFDSVPNVVPYAEGINYLVFLRTTEGTVNIDRLKQKLIGQNLLVKLAEPYTLDGRTIEIMEQTREWHFGRVPQVSVNIAGVQQAIRADMGALVAYLKDNSGIRTLSNLVVEGLPLNKCPEWCEPKDWKFIKEEIKERREDIRTTLQNHFLSEIKSTLVEKIVNPQQSYYGPTIEEGGWIEGVVLRHPHTHKMIKIVDKNKFGVIRESAWKKRNMITEAAKSVDGNHSFVGNLHVSLAIAIGHPNLGTMQAKNYLRKVGESTEERLNTLSEGVDFHSVKNYWLSLLESKMDILGQDLDKYEKEEDYCAETMDRYSTAVHQRTLATYATTFQKIGFLRENTQKARSTKDLLKVLVGKQLGELT